jgi:hypothetical protein
LDNFDERSHDLREEDDTNQHENDPNEFLIPRDGIIVSIANCRKSCESEVANHDSLGHERLFAVRFNPFFIRAKRI